MIKEEHCPLTASEWVQFLATESTLKRHDYYNQEVTILTKIIILLTGINILFVVLSILNNFNFFPKDAELVILLVTCIIFVIVLLYLICQQTQLSEKKRYEENVIDLLGDIICDILNGKLVESDEVRKKYMDIWDKKLWDKQQSAQK